MKLAFTNAKFFRPLLLLIVLVYFYRHVDRHYGFTYVASIFRDNSDQWLLKHNVTQTSDQYFKAFEMNHLSIVQNIKPERYVYVVPSAGGYGNKMYSVISAFLLALITNSAIIIYWPQIESYIEEPIPMSYLTEPTAIENELSFLYKPNGIYRYKSRNGFSIAKTLRKMQSNIPYRSRYLFQGSIVPLFFEFASNPEYFDKLKRYGLASKEVLDNSSKVNRELGLRIPNYHLNELYQVTTQFILLIKHTKT